MSNYLIAQYRTLHTQNVYGASSLRRAPYILPHVKSLKAKTVLDYGCGQSALYEKIEKLGTQVTRYDPAIPSLSKKPGGKFDLVINIDVMEHLPEDEIDGFIADIASYSSNALFIIDTIPAKTILPDGQNAHLTVRPPSWWQARLKKYFPHVEPFYVRPQWRAAFRTWPYSPFERAILKLHSMKYRLQKRLT
ncbi:MAG: class I SAM-dependent methyltransferase [Rhodomicrobiaceae bacterium]